MDKPKVAGKKPIRVDLEANKTYAWCSCGNSSNQPWCDGSHKGTAFTPYLFQVEPEKTAGMCTCKQSKNGAFCDGSHKNLA